jgi:hypothetical protein
MSFPRILARAPEKRKVFDTTCRLYHRAGSQAAQPLKLSDLCGLAALHGAIGQALGRNTARASSVAFLLRKQQRSLPAPLMVDLSRPPEALSIDVRPHSLEPLIQPGSSSNLIVR